MKRFILVALMALGFYSCTDPIDDKAQDCGIVRNVAFENFIYCGELIEKPTKPIYLIINSNEELLKYFTFCDSFGSLPDFTKKRILGLMSGPKPTGGYSIKIQSVIENDCEILVDYSEKGPGDGDGVTQAITYPADYIVLPKSDKPILFRKVNPIDYAVVGSYYGYCIGTECQLFFSIQSDKVIKYLNVNYNSYDFSKYDYEKLTFKDDLGAFTAKIPTEIKNLKGQTKTFGSPDSHDQGGLYFEWSQSGVVTKIYLDNDDSTDQSQNIVAFKKVIKDKIAELKTKS